MPVTTEKQLVPKWLSVLVQMHRKPRTAAGPDLPHGCARLCRVQISRRQALQAGGLVVGGAAATHVGACSGPTGSTTGTGSTGSPAAPRTRTLTGRVAGSGTYVYLPFQVPAGVTRLDVAMTKADPNAKIGIGLFDQRGP